MPNVTTQPFRVFGAASPVLFAFTRSDLTNTVRLTYNGNGRAVYEREYLNGAAEFNVSAAALSMFRDVQTRVNNSEYMLLDENLAYTAAAWTGDREEGEFNFAGTAVNAVSQRPGPLSMEPYEGAILTEFGAVYNYGPDFPLWLAVMPKPNDGLRVFVDGSPLPGNVANEPPHAIASVNGYVDAQTSFELRTNAGAVRDSRPVKHLCVRSPRACAWVRWINQIGGYDYWMFLDTLTESNQLTKVDTYYPDYLRLQPGAPSSYIPLSAEAKRTLKVGADGVSEADFRVLAKIVFSPKIELYNADASEWERVYIDKATVNNVAPDASQSLALDLTLPIQRLQL